MNQPGGYRIDIENRDEITAACISSAACQAAFAGDVEIPRVIDQRAYNKCRSQSSEGSCQGHGLTFAQESVQYMTTGKFVRLSPDAAYYWSQQYDGIRGDNGSTLSGGLKVATQIGALTEQQMPYTPRYNPQDIPQGGKELAGQYIAKTGAELPTYRQFCEWWARGYGATWIGMSWGGAVESRPGHVTKWRPAGGGHSIGIGGWGEVDHPDALKFDSDGLPQWVWAKNSHTDNPDEVSLRGWCRWYRDAVEACLEHSFTVLIGISDMPSLKPRKVTWNDGSLWA